MKNTEKKRGNRILAWMCMVGVVIILLGAVIFDRGMRRKEQTYSIRTSRVMMQMENRISRP